MGIETKMQLVRLIHDWVLYNKEIRGKKKQEASEVRYIQMMIMELHKKVKVIWKSK